MIINNERFELIKEYSIDLIHKIVDSKENFVGTEILAVIAVSLSSFIFTTAVANKKGIDAILFAKNSFAEFTAYTSTLIEQISAKLREENAKKIH